MHNTHIHKQLLQPQPRLVLQMAGIQCCKVENIRRDMHINSLAIAAAQLHKQCTCGACISRDCSSWMPSGAIRSRCALSAADMQR